MQRSDMPSLAYTLACKLVERFGLDRIMQANLSTIGRYDIDADGSSVSITDRSHHSDDMVDAIWTLCCEIN